MKNFLQVCRHDSRGLAWRGLEKCWLIHEYKKGTPRHAKARQGTPRHAKARQGTPRHAKARQGTPRHAEARRGTPRHAPVMTWARRHARHVGTSIIRLHYYLLLLRKFRNCSVIYD